MARILLARRPDITAPAFGSITPDLGDSFGGSTHTITGTGLTGTTSVTIGGTSCSFTVNSATSITVTAPAKTAGSYDVVVTNPAGSATGAAAYEAWSPTQISNARVYQSDQGVTSASSTTRYRWVYRGDASWRPRDGAGLLSFGGKLWLLGGWDGGSYAGWGGNPTTNEVWSSSDGGATWVEELAHDDSPPTAGAGARFRRRHTAGWIVHNGAMFTIGGDHLDATYFNNTDFPGAGGYACDVWRSTDGTTWTRQTANPGWIGRMLHVVASHNGKLWLMGGQDGLRSEVSSTFYNDLWSSSDDGATWTQVDASCPWAARGMVYDAVSWNGELWLVCGGTYETSDDPLPRTYYTEVWSYNDATDTWTSRAAFSGSAREYHNVVVWGGRLWVMAGYNEVAGPEGYYNKQDVWSTTDGSTWTQEPNAVWAAGHADGVCVHGDYLYHASGNALDQQVYRLEALTGALVSAWDDQGSANQDLAQSTNAAKPLLVPNAYGTLPALEFTGAQQLRLAAQDQGYAGESFFWVGESRVSSYSRGPADNDPTAAPFCTVFGQIGFVAPGATYGNIGFTGTAVVSKAFNGSGQDSTERGTAISTNGTCQLVGVTRTTGETKCYVGTAQQGATDTTSTYNATFSGWDTLGAGVANVAHLWMRLYAAVMVPSVISGTDLTKLNKWAKKWGSST